jgi:protein-S-isoprenylcysteine O-methyltransferase Ste14
MRDSITRLIHRFRGELASPPFIFVFVWFYFKVETDYLIWLLGISVFLMGMAVRIWAQQHLHYRLKGQRELTTTGPYQFVRNPVYIGNILMCLGLTVIPGLFWFLPLALLWCATVYSIAVRFEEASLLRRYGESYQKYMSEIPRWFPRNLHLRNLGLINKYFLPSILAEIHCLLLLLPFILKEVLWNLF